MWKPAAIPVSTCTCVRINAKEVKLAYETIHSVYSKGSKALEYEYRVKTAALGTLKRYSIFSLTLYLE
jgi:hypothetical protein